MDLKDIADLARANGERTVRVLAVAFGGLGSVLAPSLDSSGASVLVVGGFMAWSWDWWPWLCVTA